jgi:hypothetical protein
VEEGRLSAASAATIDAGFSPVALFLGFASSSLFVEKLNILQATFTRNFFFAKKFQKSATKLAEIFIISSFANKPETSVGGFYSKSDALTTDTPSGLFSQIS